MQLDSNMEIFYLKDDNKYIRLDKTRKRKPTISWICQTCKLEKGCLFFYMQKNVEVWMLSNNYHCLSPISIWYNWSHIDITFSLFLFSVFVHLYNLNFVEGLPRFKYCRKLMFLSKVYFIINDIWCALNDTCVMSTCAAFVCDILLL